MRAQYTFSSAAHAAVVEVDPETGRVRVLRYVIVSDNGTMINPSVVDGQIYGSAAHGISVALGEGFVYGGDGQLLTLTLLDYGKSTTLETPHIEIEHSPGAGSVHDAGAEGRRRRRRDPVAGGDCQRRGGRAVAVRREGAASPAVAGARLGVDPCDDRRGRPSACVVGADESFRSASARPAGGANNTGGRCARRSLPCRRWRQVDLLHGASATSMYFSPPWVSNGMSVANITRSDAEEVDAAPQRRNRADRDRVGVEIVEVLVRMFRRARSARSGRVRP